MVKLNRWAILLFVVVLVLVTIDFTERFIFKSTSNNLTLNNVNLENLGLENKPKQVGNEILESYVKFDIKWAQDKTTQNENIDKQKAKVINTETLTLKAFFNEPEPFAVADIFDANDELVKTVSLKVGQKWGAHKVIEISGNTLVFSSNKGLVHLTLFKSTNSLTLNRLNDE